MGYRETDLFDSLQLCLFTSTTGLKIHMGDEKSPFPFLTTAAKIIPRKTFQEGNRKKRFQKLFSCSPQLLNNC